MNSGELTLYRGCTPVVDVRYGDDDRSPEQAVVDALAEAADVDPMDLPPLYEFVDPEMIESLFDRHDGDVETILSFTFDTWNVFLRADGRIRVCDGTRSTEPVPVFESSPA